MLALFIAVSCSKQNISSNEISTDVVTKDYVNVMIAERNMPLFADLSGMMSGPITKSSLLDDAVVSLESLLDRDRISHKKFKHFKMTEIPFKSNDNPSYAILTKDIPESANGNAISEISLFLVEIEDTLNNIVDCKVVTLVPDSDYIAKHSGMEDSFINKGVFSGAILYSDIDGTFRDVYVYGGDFCPIINAEVIIDSDRDTYDNYGFLSVIDFTKTKADDTVDGGEIEGSICIAEKKTTKKSNMITIPWFNSDDTDWGDGSEFPESGGGGGGGNSSGVNLVGGVEGTDSGGNTMVVNKDNYFGLGSPKFSLIVEDIEKYTVNLFASWNGYVEGSGEYQAGTYIICDAIPSPSFVFDRWVGDFKGKGGTVSLQVNKDIESTAYFKRLLETAPVRPCLDTLTGIMNPLMEMSLAPSNTWSKNYKGATYGMTRYKEIESDTGVKMTVPAKHNGIDLYAEPGTPIYSMFDGVVSKKSYVTEQPMRSKKYNTKNKYPPGYKGDKDGAGNRISVDSEINNENISIGYWHLLVDTPIAVNPRTGVPFKPGDVVYQGEIIAYSGRTGNAYDVPFAHLHLAIKRNGHYDDPEPYINGKLKSTGINQYKVVSSTEIINIKCH